MHSVLSALLATAKDHPAEDEPRLALADWLERHGGDDSERARGAIMRVQCRLSRLEPGDPARAEWKSREQGLLKDHLATWIEGLPPRVVDGRTEDRSCAVERGFLRPCFGRELWVDGASVDAPIWEWVDGLVLVDPRVEEIQRLAASPLLAKMNHLGVGPAGWAGWTGDEALGTVGARALASSPHLTRLVSLNLSDCVIGPDGAKALADSPGMRNLTSLDLSGWDCTPANLIRDEGASALADSPHLAQLTSLDLMENCITAEGAKALAASPHLTRLTALNLMGNPIGPEGARALATSPFLTGLKTLGLHLTSYRFHSLARTTDPRELEDAKILLQNRFGSGWTGRIEGDA
jgi:uncharacterized protein (TIGR02996 family)